MSDIKKGTSNKKMDRQSYAQMFGPKTSLITVMK